MVWYSHLFQNFPQFIVIHTVKGFGIVNKAEIDVFLECSCFFDDPVDVGSLIAGSSAFSKTRLNIRKFTVHILEGANNAYVSHRRANWKVSILPCQQVKAKGISSVFDLVRGEQIYKSYKSLRKRTVSKFMVKYSSLQ